MPDEDLQIAEAIRQTHTELDAAREVVRNLANELADVIEVIEPALADQTKRLRQARMAALDEMRLITTNLQELRKLLIAPDTDRMLKQGDRFLALCHKWKNSAPADFSMPGPALLAHPMEK